MEVINPDDYAIVIGVDHYPEYRCLRGAVADANDFHAWLLDPQGGGLDASHCVKILSPDLAGFSCTTEPLEECRWSPDRKCTWFPESMEAEPVKQRVEKGRKKLMETASRRKKQTRRRARRLYFYYSGHGLTHDPDGAHLCLADWSERSRLAALDSKSYLDLFVNRALFDEVIFFLDCCRIWGVELKRVETDDAPPMPDPEAKTVRTWVVFAAEYLGAAREGNIAGEPVVRGIFTRVLLDGLRGAAARPEGGITASALASLLGDRVPDLARKMNKSQKPSYAGNAGPTELAQLVFGRALPVSQVEIHFEKGLDGWLKLIGPKGSVIHEGNPAHGFWDLRLVPNRLYALQDQEGRIMRLSVSASKVVHHVDF